MHYEKKEVRTASTYANLDRWVLALLATVMIIFVLCIHAPSEFWLPIKFIDIVNIVAQAATAAAFFLAIHQYRKNNDLERQRVLIEESRVLIDKMKKLAEEFPTSAVSTEDATLFINKISGHGGNFNAIFKEVNEGIQKAILRMHWQDFYFIELSKAVEHFNSTYDISNYGVSDQNHLNALVAYSGITVKINTPLPIYEPYFKAQYIANLSYIKSQLTVSNEIRASMFVFERLFFDNDSLKDHLYGCLNLIDVRVRSPLLAVLNEQFMGSQVKRDPKAFQAFWPT